MIGVAHEDQINAVFLQAGIVRSGKNGYHILHSLFSGVAVYEIQASCADVHGVNPAVRSGGSGQQHGEVSSSGPDIGHGLSFFQGKSPDHPCSLTPRTGGGAVVIGG